MTLRHTTTAALLAVLALVGGAVAAMAAPPAPLGDQPTVGAEGAANWLIRSIDADGLADGPGGAPDANTARQTAMALALAGSGDAVVDRVLDALAARPDALVDSTGADRPAAVAELIITLVAAGRDPRAFGASGSETDLVARLLATERVGGDDSGLFGSQDPTYDGAYRQGLSLIALAAADSSSPSGVAWLDAQRCDDGSFTAYRADVSVACPAIDPATFTGPDTNSTALALAGLAAAGQTTNDATVAWITSHLGGDGGWAYLPSPGATADPNSSALVISGLDAAGVDVDALATPSPRSTLMRFQFGCDSLDADRGAFWFPPFVEEDGYYATALATSQALIALAEVDLSGTAAPPVTESAVNCGTAPTTTAFPEIDIIDAVSITAPSTTAAPATPNQVLGTATVRTTTAAAATPRATAGVSYVG